MLPLRAAAVGGIVFGASCLIVLVVVTAVNGDDALSTVALALAVLAFTVQLIVFIAQQDSASEQTRRNEELHGRMREILVEISEKSASTHEDVRTMMDRTLEPFLSKYTSDTKAGGGDIGAVVNQITKAADGESRPDAYPPRRPTPEDPARLETLLTYPDEDEVGDSLDLLKALPEIVRRQLQLWGRDEIASLEPNSAFDPGLTAPIATPLEEEGLVKRIGESDASDSLARLTDRGREVARLLTAPGDPPGYLEGLSEIRDELPKAS